MKKTLLFMLISYQSLSQTFYGGGEGGSITIHPNGISGQFNRFTGSAHSNIKIGINALNKNVAGFYGIAIGNHALQDLEESQIANVAIGHLAMSSTIRSEGSLAVGTLALSRNTYGAYNVALGFSALGQNITGSNNVAIGYYSGGYNSTGSHNIAIGSYAMFFGTQTGRQNIGIGGHSLYRNSTGASNVSIGHSSMHSNSSGTDNSALGDEALYNNVSGNSNVAVGTRALHSSTGSSYTTALGHQAGLNNTGSFNTFLGHNADIVSVNVNNSTAIGYGATVDASNKIRIGNSAISVIEGQVPWSNTSDRRMKENIVYQNRLGLDFIKRLRTVSYNFIADENKTHHDGFIAQDIEQIMKELGVQFSGLKKSDNGTYSLAYSDFVIPLVNAVKEQQTEIEQLKSQNQILIKKVEGILAKLEQVNINNNVTETR